MNTITRLGLFASALALASCAPGGKSPSGFLSNYKQLDGGYGTTDAVSAYVKPGVNLKKYDSAIIDPATTIIATPGISPQIKDQLAAYVVSSLNSQISGDLKIVSTPGPTTLRIRTALTDVIEGQKAGKPVTTTHPEARSTLTGKLGSAEVASFISQVSFEGEIVDSVTGERLLASVDHRLGNKREATATTTWAAVQSGVKQGATRLHDRFKAIRNH